MILFRSCYSTTTTLCKPKPLLFHPIPKHFIIINNLSIKHSYNNNNNNNNNMSSSSRPSAFDALMSNARAAASKSKTTSSPKKRKTLTPKPSITESNSSQLLPKPETVNSTPVEPETRELNDIKQDKPNPNLVLDNETQALKKQKVISVDESIVELRKKAVKFDVKKAAYWGEGERVPFLFLVRVFDEISKESGRIVITEIVCNMLRTVIETTPDDLVAVVYLLANRIAPAHEGLELGIGDASIIKALAEACGAKEAHIKKQYKELGDLGLVEKASRSSQPLMRKPQPLTVVKVFDTFKVIAKESGKDSQDKKKNHIKGLLVAATDCEPHYLIRLLQAKLQIGLAEQTLLTALGHAIVYTEKHPSPHTGSPLEEAAVNMGSESWMRQQKSIAQEKSKLDMAITVLLRVKVLEKFKSIPLLG